MSGEIALDTSVAVRFLNGDRAIVARVLALPEVVLPVVAVGEWVSYFLARKIQLVHYKIYLVIWSLLRLVYVHAQKAVLGNEATKAKCGCLVKSLSQSIP
jgi:predicted nucleic acid-binding protein